MKGKMIMAGLTLPGVKPRNAQLAGQYMNQATNSYSQLTKKTGLEIDPPDKTAGGAMGAMTGGALAGAAVGGPYAGPAAVAGAAAMGIGYLLS